MAQRDGISVTLTRGNITTSVQKLPLRNSFHTQKQHAEILTAIWKTIELDAREMDLGYFYNIISIIFLPSYFIAGLCSAKRRTCHHGDLDGAVLFVHDKIQLLFQ